MIVSGCPSITNLYDEKYIIFSLILKSFLLGVKFDELLTWRIFELFHVELESGPIEIGRLAIFLVEEVGEVVQEVTDLVLFVNDRIKGTIPPFLVFVVEWIFKLYEGIQQSQILVLDRLENPFDAGG